MTETQITSGKVLEGMRTKEEIMAEVTEKGLTDVFNKEFETARETMDEALISDLALTYNLAKRLGIETLTNPVETPEEPQEVQARPTRVDEEIKAATITIVGIEARPTRNGKMRYSIEASVDGLGKRYFSSFFEPEYSAGARCDIEYVEKPNPNKPEYPYLNLRSIMLSNSPTPSATQHELVNDTQTTKKLIPPNGNGRADVYEIGMAKNNAAVIIAGAVNALMTPVDNKALTLEAALEKAMPEYWKLVSMLYEEGKKVRKETVGE